MARERRNAPAGTGAFQDTTRADIASRHPQSSTLGTMGAGAINWTETAGAAPRLHTAPPIAAIAPLARPRGRPPDAEPPDAATSGGSPESLASPSTSSGLGDTSIVQQMSSLDKTPTPEVIHRATKRDARGTLDDPRVQQAQIWCVSFERRHYAIRSHSNPAQEHDVKWIDGRWVCSCVAGSRGARCWHTLPVHLRYQADAREQAARLRRETEKAWPELGRDRLALLRLMADYDTPFTPGGAV